jgi:hypothetical protein
MTNIQAHNIKITPSQPAIALRLNTRNGFLDRDTFLFFFIPNCLHMAKNTYPGYLEITSVLDSAIQNGLISMHKGF